LANPAGNDKTGKSTDKSSQQNDSTTKKKKELAREEEDVGRGKVGRAKPLDLQG